LRDVFIRLTSAPLYFAICVSRIARCLQSVGSPQVGWFGVKQLPQTRNRRFRFEKFFFGSAALFLVCLILDPKSAVSGETLQITDAWVPASSQTGIDVPLSMTIANASDNADSLVRVRCPVANFSDKHTVDRGEGSPAMRSVSAIPIAARTGAVLKPDQNHLMLLQTRQPLVAGETFRCTVIFQKAGTIDAEVHVK
jgi:periplasmic copper chaperone A